MSPATSGDEHRPHRLAARAKGWARAHSPHFADPSALEAAGGPFVAVRGAPFHVGVKLKSPAAWAGSYPGGRPSASTAMRVARGA